MEIVLEQPFKSVYSEPVTTLEVGRFANGQIALRADGLRLTAAINTPLAPDEVVVRDYSEATGVAQGLIDAGVAELTGRAVESGFVTMPVMRLIHPQLKEFCHA